MYIMYNITYNIYICGFDKGGVGGAQAPPNFVNAPPPPTCNL